MAASLDVYELISLFEIMSENTPIAALPDNDLTNARGRISAGRCILFKNPEQINDKDSIIPDALNMEIATIIATRYGIILKLTLAPSFAPSIKAS